MFCSLTFPQCLEDDLEHNMYSINITWRSELMNVPLEPESQRSETCAWTSPPFHNLCPRSWWDWGRHLREGLGNTCLVTTVLGFAFCWDNFSCQLICVSWCPVDSFHGDFFWNKRSSFWHICNYIIHTLKWHTETLGLRESPTVTQGISSCSKNISKLHQIPEIRRVQ